MKRVFVIEDDVSDWAALCKILDGIYDYYPKEQKDFYDVRNNVRHLDSSNIDIYNKSKDFIKRRMDEYQPDLYLIDYELKDLAFNAVYVIKKLEIDGLVAIFTRHIIDHRTQIESDLLSLKRLYKIEVLTKPSNMKKIAKEEERKIVTKLETIMTGQNDYERLNLPVVVILTAIKEEYDAVRQHIAFIKEDNRDDTSYEKGLFVYNDQKIAKIVIRECGSGNVDASQQVERAINYHKPDLILFVGIAGSRKPEDFMVGDVICPEKIYGYQAGKAEAESFMARPELVNMTFAIREVAKRERRKEDWKILIKNEEQRNVKANIGIIASGELLIESYYSWIGDIITKHYNDTQAVEMEGFGFANAAVNQGRSRASMMYGIVRGISDILKRNEDEQADTNNERRKSSQKEYASNTAAAFAYWMIYKIFFKDHESE